MYSRWTQHLSTEEEKENFRREVRSARSVLDRLLQIHNEDEEALDRSEMDQRVYQSPSWSHLQAHKNGIRQYIHSNRLLIDLDQQKDTTNEPIRN